MHPFLFFFFLRVLCVLRGERLRCGLSTAIGKRPAPSRRPPAHLRGHIPTKVGPLFRPPVSYLAAVTMISTRVSGVASRASTQARTGLLSRSTHAFQAASI